jgi:beta-glucosidase/6-phospho-beta-glucosidase/beta-galactosidase
MSSSPFQLPEGFRFGVATSGFQVEGGYNGPGEPRNNWYRWERSGRVEPSGIALDFWNRYDEHLDRAAEAGCDAFRLSVEWARCEPRPGELDEDAFERYGEILEACHQRGLRPLVTLHHFTHPEWLGVDFWLRPEAPSLFALWVRTAVARLRPLCAHWVTVNEPNVHAINSYLTGAFPPGRRLARGDAMRALDHLLAGHVLAYEEIHALQPEAVVATNLFTYSAYHLDRLAVDLLLARRHGVSREDLPEWLAVRRAAYEAALPPTGGIERLLRRIIGLALPLERMLPRTVAAVYDSPHPCSLDVTQIDYYDPLVSNHVRLPGHRTAGGRNWLPNRLLWDDRPDPGGLVAHSRLHHESGLQLWVLENGLASRVRDGQSYPRLDGWDRLRYLRANLAAVVKAVDAGIPVGSYYHWTLADSYEWGSYEPRFGLYRIERKAGAVGWGALDSLGGDAAALYRRIVVGLRAGDRSVLEAGRA